MSKKKIKNALGLVFFLIILETIYPFFTVAREKNKLKISKLDSFGFLINNDNKIR